MNEEKWTPFISKNCVDKFISQRNGASLFQGPEEKLNNNWVPKQARTRKAETERNYPESTSNREKNNDLIALMKKFIISKTAYLYTPPKKELILHLMNPTTQLLCQWRAMTWLGNFIHEWTLFKQLKANSLFIWCLVSISHGKSTVKNSNSFDDQNKIFIIASWSVHCRTRVLQKQTDGNYHNWNYAFVKRSPQSIRNTWVPTNRFFETTQNKKAERLCSGLFFGSGWIWADRVRDWNWKRINTSKIPTW